MSTSSVPLHRSHRGFAPHGAPAEQPVIELRGVAKRFGYRSVLAGVDLRVMAGDFLLVLGNNGAGKSTLLRLLSTLMRPSEGSLLYWGKPFAAWGAPARGLLGVVAHESHAYGDLTAEENLALWSRLYEVDRPLEAIGAALERVGLADAALLPVRTFSSGMNKRLAIARLLLHQPGVLLLDEPYAGLDQASIAFFDRYLEAFKASGGTVVLVTHQFSGGVRLGNRVLVLGSGRVRYDAPQSALTVERCAALLQAHGSAAGATAAESAPPSHPANG